MNKKTFVHRILIVEDNLPFAIKLERHLKEWGHEIIGIKNNSEDAFESINQNPPTLILMDINLKGALNGIEIANKIKDHEIPIIFITGRRDLETFDAAKETNGIQYLVKPFDMLTLKGAIEFSELKEVEKVDEFLFVRRRKEIVKLKIKEIKWIQSDGNYCDLYHVDDKKYTIKLPLKTLLEQIQNQSFQRIHKSYVINIERVTGLFLSENRVRVGEELIPLGRKYRDDFLKAIDIK